MIISLWLKRSKSMTTSGMTEQQNNGRAGFWGSWGKLAGLGHLQTQYVVDRRTALSKSGGPVSIGGICWS
jgi:hypothetical protein